MPLFASIASRALSALGLQRAAPPGPTATTRAVPVDSSALSTATVAQVRSWIDAHDQGQFLQSSLLADLALRDADLLGALSQRVLALLGLPLVVEPGIDTAAARKIAKAVGDSWVRVVPRAVQHDLVSSAVMLGFAVAQVVWEKGEDGYLTPRLEPWPSDAVEYRAWERRWYVQTRTGPLAITPGDGQWVLYTPRSERAPWLWGAIRCTAEWYLRSSYSAGDASRHSEVHGIPVWGAYLPSGGRETADGRAFVSSLRGMGRNAVVPLPQGSDKSTSYDLKLVEAQADAYRIFEFLLRTAGGKMRLAILGQDLTSQNAQVGTNASSSTGRSVTQDVIAADAETLGDCLREQLLKPWARYLAGRADLAPYVYHNAKPQADKGKDAQALLTLAQAVNTFGNAGVPVDTRALLEAQGVPLLAQDVQQAGELFQYHLAFGVVTINEARARLGLAPVPGGDKPPAAPIEPSGLPGAARAPRWETRGGQLLWDCSCPGSPTLHWTGEAKCKACGAHRPSRLASGDPEDSAPGFLAGQAAADELGAASTAAGQAALAPDLETLAGIIEASTGYEDLQERLAAALAGMDPAALADVTERTLILAELAGRWAVLEDL